jgi:hypothetical protein
MTEEARKKADAYCVRQNNGNPDWKWDEKGHACVQNVCMKIKTSETAEPKCCPEGTTFTPAPGTDEWDGLGACCTEGQQIQEDQGHYECCPEGEIYTWDPATDTGKCAPPPPPPPPEPEKEGCDKATACPTAAGLGIKYGRCYTLQDTNGLQLGRELNPDVGIYRSGGEVNNLVFRICYEAGDCKKNMGKQVGLADTWFMQDQIGRRDQQGAGWFGNSKPHMGITPNAGDAAEFVGAKYCFDGKCGICLRLFPDTGIDAPCPMPVGDGMDRTHLGASNNPASCKAYYFYETPCLPWVA